MASPRLTHFLSLMALGGCGATEVSVAPTGGELPTRALVASSYSPDAPAAAAHKGADIRRSHDMLFYVDALVNGTRVRFVVDSGSSVVVLTREDAKRAGVNLGAGSMMQTAGGVTTMRRAVLRKVHVAGRALDHVDAAIVDDSMGMSLLGQSALSQLEMVSFSGDSLKLR